MNKRLKTQAVKTLVQSLLALKNEEEAYAYLEDLCTVHEILTLAQRLQVAVLLKKEFTYQEITELTNASSATVSRVNRTLEDGSRGYEIVLRRLTETASSITKEQEKA